FRLALSIVATVISVSDGWAVADCGLKALGMDHGDPTVIGHSVWYCSDEHVTFGPHPVTVGDRVRVLPAHVDPTVAYHERMHVAGGDEGGAPWDFYLRGWYPAERSRSVPIQCGSCRSAGASFSSRSCTSSSSSRAGRWCCASARSVTTSSRSNARSSP